MTKPVLYTVFWRNAKGESKHFETNCEHAALQCEVRRNGTCYIDTRFNAKMRLYNWYINRDRFLTIKNELQDS